MPKFTTRVELHGASREDYAKLHEKMRAAGFATTITGGNGKSYHLPPAEYRSDMQGSTTDVANKAAAIAETVKPNPAILVTEGFNCAWIGLETVNALAKTW